MNFGENLKKLRKEKHLSQESLADKLNISRQAVSKWESNSSYPDINNLIKLKDIFNVSIDDLIIIDKKDSKVILEKNSSNDKMINKYSNFDEEEDKIYENLIIGGFIIGISIGFITENFSFGLIGALIGMGIGIILEDKKAKNLIKSFKSYFK